VLTPGRYVGAEAAVQDDTPFAERFAELQAKLDEQFKESTRLQEAIRQNLEHLKHGL
jgi:type I restriction enzyme M protein